MPAGTIESGIRQLREEINTKADKGVKIEHRMRGNKSVEKNGLPKTRFNGATHVRPKGTDGKEKRHYRMVNR